MAVSYTHLDVYKRQVGELCYKVVKRILESGVQFDFGHFWEDICFKNGPLVIPSVFAEKVEMCIRDRSYSLYGARRPGQFKMGQN